LGDLINRFQFFIGVEFIVEINKVCSSTSLAVARTVLSEMSYLSAFKTGIVGCASGGSSSSCIRTELSMSLALPTPISVRSTGSVQIHWDGLVGHPPGCISGVKLWPSLSSTLGMEAWAALLIEEVPLPSLVAAEESWSSALERLIWLVHRSLEIATSSIETSGVGPSSSFKNAFDQHSRLSDFDSLVFESSVVCWNGGYEYSFHDVSWEPFDEQMEHFVVPLRVSGIATEFFESGDVVIDFQEFHTTVFELSPGSVFFLGILVLLCKFMQELIPYIGDIVKDGVQSVQEIPYVSFPSGDLSSMHEGEGKSDFFDW